VLVVWAGGFLVVDRVHMQAVVRFDALFEIGTILLRCHRVEPERMLVWGDMTARGFADSIVLCVPYQRVSINGSWSISTSVRVVSSSTSSATERVSL